MLYEILAPFLKYETFYIRFKIQITRSSENELIPKN